MKPETLTADNVTLFSIESIDAELEGNKAAAATIRALTKSHIALGSAPNTGVSGELYAIIADALELPAVTELNTRTKKLKSIRRNLEGIQVADATTGVEGDTTGEVAA